VLYPLSYGGPGGTTIPAVGGWTKTRYAVVEVSGGVALRRHRSHRVALVVTRPIVLLS
jgi:hypothetical protein